MYIDKLYNKMYADGDINSLNILRQEIKVFSSEGGIIDQYTKNMQRSIANKLTNVTKSVGKLLAIGVPVTGVIAYLNNSEDGREWLKENTGFDYDKTKDNLSDKWDQLTGNTIDKNIVKDVSIIEAPKFEQSQPEESISKPELVTSIPEVPTPGITSSDAVKSTEPEETQDEES